MDQERVGDQQPVTASASDRAPPATGRPRKTAASASAGHRARAQHRRLPPRHRPEQDQHQHAARSRRAEPEPAQQRAGERQHERDVLPAHREQVREARRRGTVVDERPGRRGCRRGGSPRATARSVGGQAESAPRNTTPRAAFATRSSGDAGGPKPDQRAARSVADRVAPPVRGVEAVEGLGTRPRTVTRSPGLRAPEAGVSVARADDDAPCGRRHLEPGRPDATATSTSTTNRGAARVVDERCR